MKISQLINVMGLIDKIEIHDTTTDSEYMAFKDLGYAGITTFLNKKVSYAYCPNINTLRIII